MRKGNAFYRESLPDNFKIYQERYEKTNNPVNLFQAFRLACEYDVKPPEWVSDKLYDVFAEWMETGQSLDILFETKKSGQGRTSAYKETELYKRNLPLMEAIDIFMRNLDITALEAAQKAVDAFRFLEPPSAEQMLKVYYRDQWNKRLAEIKQYQPDEVKSLLDYEQNPGNYTAIKKAFFLK